MVDVRVNFDYEAEQDDELSIKIGDIIKNVSMPDGGWWEGELNGKKGLFPDNFVEIIKNPDKEKDRDKEKNTADIKAAHRLSTKGHVAELANRLKDDVHVGGGPPKKRESLNKKRFKAKVTFAYSPENDDELSLEVGDIVEIFKQEEEGWWEGNLNGKTGMFPSNFVEPVDENGEEPEKTDEPKKEGDFKEIRGKKIQGVGLGNIFGGGPIKLRPTGTGSVKKVGPPETAERKKEDKTEMVPVREKSDLKPRRKPKPQKIKSGRRVNEDARLRNRSIVNAAHVNAARGRSQPETKIASYVYVSPSNSKKTEKIEHSSSATGRTPVRCSTPNRRGNADSREASFIMMPPMQALQDSTRENLPTELDISSIEPRPERKSRIPRPTVQSPGKPSARFSTPTPSGTDNHSVFVSPPLEPNLGLNDGSLQGSPSLNTSNLTDSMILHKRRLSSPRRHGGRKEPVTKSTPDHSVKEADDSEAIEGEPLDMAMDEHNQSSNSLSRFKSFVKNIFTPSSSNNPEVDKSQMKSPPGHTSLEHVEKKHRWTLPLLRSKSSPSKHVSKLVTVLDPAAGDPQAEQDSSSNNSKGVPDPIPCMVQTDHFIHDQDEREQSPETYLASLDKYGKLPRSMQVIAGRYNLSDVLEGKQKALHSSFGHLPIQMYYFDEGKNPYVEQHDNSDDELESCSWNNDVSRDDSIREKSERSLERGIDDIAEKAVSSILYNLIYCSEQSLPTRTAGHGNGPSRHRSRKHVHVAPITPEKGQSTKHETEQKSANVKLSPNSEARRKFFTNAAAGLPKEDPFCKYIQKYQPDCIPSPSKIVEKNFPSRDMFHKYDRFGKLPPMLFDHPPEKREKFLLHRVHPLTSSHVSGASQNKWDPPVVNPVPWRPENTFYVDSISSDDGQNYSLSLMAKDSSNQPTPCNSVEDLGPAESEDHNYSISLLSSFQEIGEDRRPDKYPSFMSICSDELDITAPIAKPDPSIESIYALPPVICPDYQLWRGGKRWLPQPSTNGTANNSRDATETTSDDITVASELSFDLDKAFVLDVQELARREMTIQTCKIGSESQPEAQIQTQTEESGSLTGEEDREEHNEVKFPDKLTSNIAEADLSQAESITVGIQFPEDAFLPDIDDRDLSLGSPAAVSSFRSDVYNYANGFFYQKGFREPHRRPSSWMYSQSLSLDQFQILNHDSSPSRNSLRRPLSCMYPESSNLEPQKLTPQFGSTKLTGPRIPKSEQKNRYLVIDSSSTLSSVHSLRDSVYSRDSVIMDGDPKLVKGSSEKRKPHRLWRKVKSKKEVPPVQLISYKKVYEPGTAMYDVVPLLSRSLTGGDQLDIHIEENMNQNFCQLQDSGLSCKRQLYEVSEAEAMDLSRAPPFELENDDPTKEDREDSSFTTVSYDLTLSDTEGVTDNSVDLFFHNDDSGTVECESILSMVKIVEELESDKTLTPQNDLSLEKTTNDSRTDAGNSTEEEEDDENPPRYFSNIDDLIVDEIASLPRHDIDISFNALRLRIHREDQDESGILQEELGSPSSVSVDDCQTEMEIPKFYHLGLDEFDTDTFPSSLYDGDTSPLFSPRSISDRYSARSTAENITENCGDQSIDEMVADKSLNAQQYYSLTNVEPSASSSSAEFSV